MANFIVVVFSESQCLYLKYEYSIRQATVMHHSTVDTVFRKILPIEDGGKRWLYLFAENGMLVQICPDDESNPLIRTVQSNF